MSLPAEKLRSLPALASEINAEHEAAERAINDSLSHARRCGELLLEVKAQCGHGKFGAWLADNFRASHRTANGYMRITRLWADLPANSQALANLGIEEALAALAEPRAHGTSDEVDEAAELTTGTPDTPERVLTIHRADETYAAHKPETDNEDEPMPPTASATEPKRSGPRIMLPDGMDAEQATRAAMALEDGGASTEEAATELGLNLGTYRQMRYVVLLADRDDLNERDAQTAADALDYMSVHGTIRYPMELVQSLVDRIYGAGNRSASPARSEQIRAGAFDRAMGALIQACSMAGTLDVPHLSPERATAVLGELKQAEESVKILRHRIKEMVK